YCFAKRFCKFFTISETAIQENYEELSSSDDNENDHSSNSNYEY
ncbi:16111_t:CDS:1, partial [Cetraspora pellucida]